MLKQILLSLSFLFKKQFPQHCVFSCPLEFVFKRDLAGSASTWILPFSNRWQYTIVSSSWKAAKSKQTITTHSAVQEVSFCSNFSPSHTCYSCCCCCLLGIYGCSNWLGTHHRFVYVRENKGWRVFACSVINQLGLLKFSARRLIWCRLLKRRDESREIKGSARIQNGLCF